MDSVSTRLLDRRYRITNTLTQNTQESRFTARHVALDIPVRIVALHLPAASASPRDAAVAHLWALAARATSLRHPSLVRMRDCFHHQHTFSVVTEEVPGETLAARLARHGGLSLRETLTYGLQLCDLLAYVAREGAMLTPFLSIMPESLVIQDDDRIVLTDLGIGHWASQGEHVYAPDHLPYLAPETLAGAAADIRADVYSVAAVFYTALTGEPPAPLGLGLLPLTAFAQLAPAALGDAIERALQPDPAARFSSPDEFGRALARSVRATMPAVAALARQPHRQPTDLTVARALGAAPKRDERERAPRPLRRTGERALAALTSALRLGA